MPRQPIPFRRPFAALSRANPAAFPAVRPAALTGVRPAVLPVLLFLLLACWACGPGPERGPTGVVPVGTADSGRCTGRCDAAGPSIPVLEATSGRGDVTTYGSMVDPRPSAGGACNYGATGVLRFAAIQESRLPGDLQGQWRGGRACGQCLRVRVRTEAGWKEAVARIMDKCPDAHCGVDLAGEPAREVMGSQPGRYAGEWAFVSCEGVPGVSDGPPRLFVKEGSNPWWSLVQVRDPAERVLGIRVRRAAAAPGDPWTDLQWAGEAENFFAVPEAVLQDSSLYDIRVELPGGARYATRLPGGGLAVTGERPLGEADAPPLPRR